MEEVSSGQLRGALESDVSGTSTVNHDSPAMISCFRIFVNSRKRQKDDSGTSWKKNEEQRNKNKIKKQDKDSCSLF